MPEQPTEEEEEEEEVEERLPKQVMPRRRSDEQATRPDTRRPQPKRRGVFDDDYEPQLRLNRPAGRSGNEEAEEEEEKEEEENTAVAAERAPQQRSQGVLRGGKTTPGPLPFHMAQESDPQWLRCRQQCAISFRSLYQRPPRGPFVGKGSCGA